MVAWIHTVLAEASPDELAEFNIEYQGALEASGNAEREDLRHLVTRWGGTAAMHDSPLTPDEEALVARFRTGEDVGIPWPLADVSHARKI